ncbi:uncharacterized protein DUF1232 [Pseudoxanthomonas sp. 3HH-4]|uniref:YkvA family protein n=1 Tax=Pseudoxanthomonas sp. 3HH-4 TaxID=1690214 RepID=UPI00116E9934|nr:YkvA family protein [Pseudoxanthomonas sp. 3HH-4]TQM12097.1 uncharacterized protein DUF1232 [Pseudoxanthomonas sp. 3HH-4]
MSLSIVIDLSGSDLEHLKEASQAASKAAAGRSMEDVLKSATDMLMKAQQSNPPGFVKDRLVLLDTFIAMARDEGWGLPEDEKARLRSTLAYFAEAADSIPDHVPVLGYLDDAIMIELCARELCHEVDAYNDFCEFREREAQRHGLAPQMVGRADWLTGRREELQERMRRRRSRLGTGNLGVGYGASSGYGGASSYADSGWRPSVLRIR